MDDRPTKKRKVRKGTRSCWQCRKRKIRCEFASNEEQTCAGCKIRGTTCVSQEYTDDEPSGPPERGLAQRLGRLEELMLKLADKMGPEQLSNNDESKNNSSSTRTNNNNNIATPASSVSGSSVASEVFGTPDNLAGVPSSVAVSAMLGAIPSQPDRDHPLTSPQSQGGSKYEKICHELHAMFPSSQDAKTIVQCSKGPVFLLALFYSYQDILEGRSPPTMSLSTLPDVSKHPAILAKHLLQLTVCLQQLPPNFDPTRLGLKRSIQDTMSDWSAAAGQVISNDELVGSSEGLECLILQGFYLVNSGNLRKAWLAMRRALSLAQLMGIERNASRPLKSCDPETDPELIPASHQFWYRINFCDRFLSLLLGLPAGSQDNSFASETFTAHDTPTERLEKRYTTISLRIIERNHASASEAYAITQAVDCELETAAKSMGRGWWEVPPIPDYTDTTGLMTVMSHIMLQIHHHSLLILLHLPYMLRNPTNGRYDYSKHTCLESSRAVLRRCVIFRTANNAAFSCRHIDYSSLMAAMTLLLGHLSRPPGIRDEDWAKQRDDDRALTQTITAKMEELAVLNDDKLSGESARIIKQLLPIIDCCSGNSTKQCCDESEVKNLQLSIPYLGTVNIKTTSNQSAGSHLVDLSHSQLPTPTNTTNVVSPRSLQSNQETSSLASFDPWHIPEDTIPHEYPCAGFSADYLGWPCPGVTAEAGDWTFQGVDTTYWSLLNSGISSSHSQ
ncbi:putative transcriptional regulatory protein C11D3.11c [Colletotrichum chlorophyti]|uniref:Putative transcriptional regulatory protein C11D3.11c n=1 Tax=Colletotrichum chlorophyti TaxID=708187 RepID=A0A1Q8S242_9PEZI|nr:putative transcriptional regulatory protein C11D3.11c [Colletotrichum chlorophyti]